MDSEKLKRKKEVLRMISNIYFVNLTSTNNAKSKRGIDYLIKRQITNSLVDTFRLGLALGSIHEIECLMEYQEEALELRLLVEDKINGGLRPYYKNRIMFPFFSLSGEIVGFTGRDITGASKAKYLNSPESELFQKGIAMYGFYQSYRRICERRQVFLVEGNIDVLRMYQHEYPVIGLSSHEISPFQASIISSMYPDIFLLMDGDKAGRTGARKVTQVFRDLNKLGGRKVRLPRNIDLPDGFDPDKLFIEKLQPDDYIYERMHDQSITPFIPQPRTNYFMQNKCKYEGSDPKIIREMTDIVEVIGSRIPLRRAGANYIASCPFHEEKTASFVVSQSKRIYKCFGCGAHGDVFDFIMKYDGVGFAVAIQMLGGKKVGGK